MQCARDSTLLVYDGHLIVFGRVTSSSQEQLCQKINEILLKETYRGMSAHAGMCLLLSGSGLYQFGETGVQASEEKSGSATDEDLLDLSEIIR